MTEALGIHSFAQETLNTRAVNGMVAAVLVGILIIRHYVTRKGICQKEQVTGATQHRLEVLGK